MGTAYSFQGEERDVMFLSFTVDKTSHHSAYNHINKEDVFNVSITRARNQQNIYTSVDTKDIKHDSLFRKFIEYYTKPFDISATKTNYHDEFVNEVTDYLNKIKINKFWIGFPIAGLEIDILIKQENKYYGIDLIGFPGQFQDAFGLERNRILHRAGITIFPLPYSDWYFENKTTQTALYTFLKK